MLLLVISVVAALWLIAPEDREWWQALPARLSQTIESFKSKGRPPLIANLPHSTAIKATPHAVGAPVSTHGGSVSQPARPIPVSAPIDVTSLFAHLMPPSQVPKPPFMEPVPPKLYKSARGHGKPVQFGKRKLDGVSFYQTTIDLSDPDAYFTVELANNAAQANSAESSHGDEQFESLVKKAKGAVVINGTFFSKDEQKRVMGNMVSQGRFLKYSVWENYGTTVGLKVDNTLEMITARADGQPPWDNYWFSITCGPRLVKDGQISLNPESEGFSDSHVLGIGPRCALGFPRSRDRLYLVTFLSGLSLAQEANLMKEIGCLEAMNLDGGASRALARNGDILVEAGRPLTNVIVVYDSKHPAPEDVVDSWHRFVEGARATTASRL